MLVFGYAALHLPQYSMGSSPEASAAQVRVLTDWGLVLLCPGCAAAPFDVLYNMVCATTSSYTVSTALTAEKSGCAGGLPGGLGGS
jgi:hypothetical protein